LFLEVSELGAGELRGASAACRRIDDG
jgi:hypothetical protein